MKRTLLLILFLGTLLLIPASDLPNTAFPAGIIPAAAKRPVLTGFCTTLTTFSQPPLGHAFNLTFTCASSPAFTAQQTTTSTPTYTLPAGYSALYVTGPITQLLTNGSPISLPPGNYQYLAQYDGSPVGTLSSFTITWSNR